MISEITMGYNVLCIYPAWQATTNANNLEKKQKKFDQQINEWKIRCDELQAEVDSAQKEARSYSTEVSYRSAFDLVKK